MITLLCALVACVCAGISLFIVRIGERNQKKDTMIKESVASAHAKNLRLIAQANLGLMVLVHMLFIAFETERYDVTVRLTAVTSQHTVDENVSDLRSEELILFL